jgi:hypothetical protein
MVRRVWEYIVTVWRVYKTHVSGWLLAIVAIGLNIAAAYFLTDPSASAEVVKWSAKLTAVGAIYLVFVAQYDAWRQERCRAEKAEFRLVPRIKIGVPQQHFWGLKEQRGSTGTGYFFGVTNLSEAESLESLRAELISMEPDVIGILPFPLHIRNLDYQTSETSVNPGLTMQFDLATGPDHNAISQAVIMIPGIISGDRGSRNAVPIEYGRYRMTVRVGAMNCPPQDIVFELWIEDNFLRCIAK